MTHVHPSNGSRFEERVEKVSGGEDKEEEDGHGYEEKGNDEGAVKRAAVWSDTAGQRHLLPSSPLLLTASLAVLGGGFHFGFQMAIINPMADVLQRFLADAVEKRYGMPVSPTALRWAWSALAGCLFLGAALGAAAASFAVHTYGPARCLVASSMLQLLAASLSGFASLLLSAEVFATARLVSGVALGIGMTAHGVLLAEISPAHQRGLICSFGGFATNLGFILASALGLPMALGTRDLWHYAYFLVGVPCVVVIIFFTICARDSPVFLLRSGNEEAARAALRFYSPNAEDSRLAEIRADLDGGFQATPTLSEMWRDRATRRAALLSMLLNTTVAFSGIIAVTFFGTFMLREIGFSESSAAVANCASSLSGTAGALTAALAVDKVGRRLLVVGSLLSLALLNTLFMSLVLLYEAAGAAWLRAAYLGLLIAFLFIFSAGAGPAALFLGAELSPAASRARVQAAAIGAQYAACFISPVLYYPLQRFVGAFSFLLFVVPLTGGALAFHRWLPETSGRRPRQIRRHLESEEKRRGGSVGQDA